MAIAGLSIMLYVGWVTVETVKTHHCPNVTGGYYLFQADSRIALCDSKGHFVVATQIVLIGAVDDLAIGKTEDPKLFSLPDDGFPVGYFVVDTRTGKVTSGLSLQEFEKLLAGSSETPALRSPARWALTHW